MKRNPGFAIVLLDSEHEMMEGSEADMSDKLRREYDFHKGKKNPYTKKTVIRNLPYLHRHSPQS